MNTTIGTRHAWRVDYESRDHHTASVSPENIKTNNTIVVTQRDVVRDVKDVLFEALLENGRFLVRLTSVEYLGRVAETVTKVPDRTVPPPELVALKPPTKPVMPEPQFSCDCVNAKIGRPCCKGNAR